MVFCRGELDWRRVSGRQTKDEKWKETHGPIVSLIYFAACE